MSNQEEHNVTFHTEPETKGEGLILSPPGDIFYEAKAGNVDKVQKILDSGVNATVSDYDLRTPLHIASGAGHLGVVKLLLDRGANPNARDVHDWTPLDEAMRNQKQEVEEILKEKGGKNGHEGVIKPTRHLQLDTLECVARGDLESVKNNIQSVGVNFSDYDGRTPLHLAVAEGHLEITKYLIEQGADKHAEDRWGTTPGDEAKRHAVRSGQDKMIPLFFADDEDHTHGYLSPFSIFYCIVELVIVILFCTVTEYAEVANPLYSTLTLNRTVEYAAELYPQTTTMMNKYPQFMDVHVMIFIGFGFLMTFLRRHNYGSVGLTFLVSALVIQWHILVGGFFEHLIVEGHLTKIKVSLDTLIFADFACGAVLITYGVLLGKVSPFQLLFIGLFEIIFFSINESIGLSLVITDIGGSMVVHMFGAFFGLSASFVMKKKEWYGNKENAAVYHSDMFAMIGTVFLWMFWPSFNGAMSSESRQMRVTINTVLSLAGSCVAGYIASHVLRREKKFDMVDVQNATLAGGVAMGTCADLIVQPGPALIIGLVSGAVSVYGYVHVQPFLETKIGLHDTCGVNNLHGMPSLIGAIAGVIVISLAKKEEYGAIKKVIFAEVHDEGRTMSEQAVLQLAFTGITLCMSIIGGAVTGAIVNGMGQLLDPLAPKQLFKDSQHWEVPGLEIPYFFDHRGEISRDPKKDDNGLNKEINLKLEGLIEKVKTLEKKALQGTAFNMNLGTFLEQIVPKIKNE